MLLLSFSEKIRSQHGLLFMLFIIAVAVLPPIFSTIYLVFAALNRWLCARLKHRLAHRYWQQNAALVETPQPEAIRLRPSQTRKPNKRKRSNQFRMLTGGILGLTTFLWSIMFLYMDSAVSFTFVLLSVSIQAGAAWLLLVPETRPKLDARQLFGRNRDETKETTRRFGSGAISST